MKVTRSRPAKKAVHEVRAPSHDLVPQSALPPQDFARRYSQRFSSRISVSW
jgi:hypothetical protein